MLGKHREEVGRDDPDGLADLSHRRPAGGELFGDRIQVKPGSGGQRAGQNPVAELARGALADGSGDKAVDELALEI